MEKEISRNRQTTEQVLLDAVRELVEESGFENVGVNAVATRAGVSKMLIYRYFGSLDGLIAAYIRQHDFWINFDEELPDRQHVGEFVKRMFRGQVALLRENYTLNRLYRWELTTDNAVIRELREKREAKGCWLVDAVSRLTGYPRKEIAVVATLINTSICYLTLLAENCEEYNGIRIQEDAGWRQLEEGIDTLIDLWLSKKIKSE